MSDKGMVPTWEVSKMDKEQILAWKSDAIDHQGEGMNEMSPLQYACSVQARRVERLCNELLALLTAQEPVVAWLLSGTEKGSPVTFATNDSGDLHYFKSLGFEASPLTYATKEESDE